MNDAVSRGRGGVTGTSMGEIRKKEGLVLMRRLPVWFFLSLVVAIALPLGVAAADTGISFGLHIGDRYRGPSLGFYDQPNVVAVPGRVGVYYVQGSDQDLYRYNNTWYMNYNGDWYRADSYNGPFTFVGYRSVPQAVYTVPSDYRHTWTDYRDTHYDWARSQRYSSDPYSNTAVGGSFTLRIGDRYRGPDLGFYDEPAAYPVGHSGVYYVRDSDNDVYRYGNAWYMNYNGDWYRANSYQGPWIFVSYRSVPRQVYRVPRRFRRTWSDYRDRHYFTDTSYRRTYGSYGRSGLGISLRIGDRYTGPSLGFYDEPTMIRVPGTYVYYTQDADNDVYRYGNYWYMNYNGDWYRAGSFRGPWVFVSYRSVPREVYSVPTQYRRRWSDYRDQHYDTETSSVDNRVYYRTETTTPSISLRIGSRYNGPSISFSTEPDVVAVPGTRGVYYVQDSDTDIYRYGNNWYMNYNGDWYRAGSYNGPWIFVGYRSVPRDVYSVPSTYRRNWSDFRDRHYDDSDNE